MPAPSPCDPAPGHPIIVFDAQCVLCSANAQFVLRHDRQSHFRLAAMQGAVGTALYRRFGIDPADPDTLIVMSGNHALRDSHAVFAIWTALGWPWKAIAVLAIIPKAWRDLAYRWIARHRYRLFGRRASCWVPSADYAERLL